MAAQPLVSPTYTRTGAGAANEALIREHMPLVRRIAWHVHGSVSSSVEVEDLVQTGLVALVEAAGSFEDRGQVTFAQYLGTRIRGAMIDELRRQATITRGAMRRRREIAEAESALSVQLGRAPSDEEVAFQLGVPTERLRQERDAAQPIRFEPIDGVYTDDSPWFMSDDPNPFELLESEDLRQALIEAIGRLSEREAQVIQLYYVEELNLEEIGQVLGVGAARVCQIKKSAHDRLKKALEQRIG
ncbi:RNA polymerase sigma factor FliA [Sphingomonas sp.]|jgi:RNA polymerase sigma factor for flagellar operon FliA|uniref:sigma-70 family RNA polymerase sigma factor n=1 Tax=Sphingomonas sp. TaxID=28214 RepID=UPI002DB5877C|nr:RNA polymerase sigma factor FliA [Sphingomonas sp.]HEU4968701.1 RNA polymerase sigma factor FliA [Sphingomonas sp.]